MPIIYSQNLGGGGSALPDQTGNSGKFLTTNGSIASWGTPAGGGLSLSSYKGLNNDGKNVTNNTDTLVQFDTSLSTVGTDITITTGASWKATVNSTGVYWVYSTVLLATALPAAAYVYMFLYKNGVTYEEIHFRREYATDTNNYVQYQGGVLVNLVATDNISIFVKQQSGGTIALDANGFNYLNIFRVN